MNKSLKAVTGLSGTRDWQAELVANALLEHDPDGSKALKIAEKYIKRTKTASAGSSKPRS